MNWLGKLLGKQESTRLIEFGGEKFTPFKFGSSAVLWAADSSANEINRMISLGNQRRDDNIFSRMAVQPMPAQMHVIGLQLAIYLVGAGSLAGMTNDVLDEVQNGISETLLGNKQGASVGKAMKSASDIYAGTLKLEMNCPNEDIGFNVDGDPTARLLVELLKEAYVGAKNLPPLQISALDTNALLMLITGLIVGQFKALAEMKLSFIPG